MQIQLSKIVFSVANANAFSGQTDREYILQPPPLCVRTHCILSFSLVDMYSICKGNLRQIKPLAKNFLRPNFRAPSLICQISLCSLLFQKMYFGDMYSICFGNLNPLSKDVFKSKFFIFLKIWTKTIVNFCSNSYHFISIL